MNTSRTVLITGASTGIGEDAAISMAKKGYRVWAGVRKTEDGEALKARASKNLEYVILDVTNPEHIQKVARQIESLDVLVNNAGVAVGGPLECISLEQFRWQFEVNVFGLLAVTQAFLPHLRKSKGRVVNVGSISGKMASPFMGAYSASKFAVEAMSDSLRMELKPFGIAVCLIEPGPIKTPIWEKSRAKTHAEFEKLGPRVLELYGEKLERFSKLVEKTGESSIPVEHVTRAILHSVEAINPKTRYLVGTTARIQGLVNAFVPDRLRDKLILSQI